MHSKETKRTDKKPDASCRYDKQETLSSRFSRDTITGGDTYNRMRNNYAKDAKPPMYGPFGFTITV